MRVCQEQAGSDQHRGALSKKICYYFLQKSLAVHDEGIRSVAMIFSFSVSGGFIRQRFERSKIVYKLTGKP